MVLERILDCFFLGRKDGDEKVLPMVERVGENNGKTYLKYTYVHKKIFLDPG